MSDPEAWLEALCPECSKPATRTLGLGWLFRCNSCRREWGHPQGMTRVEASEALADAREFDAHERQMP